jgi:flavin reductase
MGEAEAQTIDRKLFRKVMGSFATGVTLISTQTRGEVRAMTANAFMSGSLQPPLCIVSVAARARMHGFLLETGHFGVSILAQGHERLSTHFGGKPEPELFPKFVHVGRTPLLADASAALAAEVVARHGCGDHSIFIGRIVHLRTSDRVPLVVHDGRYASLMYVEELGAPVPITEFW